MATGGTNTVFTYDDWGRTVTKSMSGHLATYQYRYGDKLKKLTTDFPDESTVGYDYDGLGKRRNRTNGNGLTWWRWDKGWNPIAEYDDSDTDWDVEGLAKTYIPKPVGHGILAQITGSDPGTGTYGYLSHDHLGSVRRIRDANKTSVGTYEYDPYGGQYALSGLALNHGFTGHTWEPNAALYFAPYRYYNPAAARWLARDPVSGLALDNGFTGHAWQADAAPYYGRHRYYNAAIARWLTRGAALNLGLTAHACEAKAALYFALLPYYNRVAARSLTGEPAGTVAGPNLYMYVRCNPAMRLDTMGAQDDFWDCWGDCMGVYFEWCPVACLYTLSEWPACTAGCLLGGVPVCAGECLVYSLCGTPPRGESAAGDMLACGIILAFGFLVLRRQRRHDAKWRIYSRPPSQKSDRA